MLDSKTKPTPPKSFLPSVCPLDCPDTCSLNVEVEGNQVKSVRGSQTNPFTAGVICNKVARSFVEFTHGEGRLTQPLRRVGPKGSGAFEPLTWAEALDLVHDGFQQAIARYGAQSILPLNYAGPHGELAGGSMDRRFFYRLGATRLERGPLCGGVRSAAYNSLFGAVAGMPPDQLGKSDLILIWGNNVTVSALHLMREIKIARKQGARVVVMDPKRIKIAEQSDLHLQVKPGTDVVLALALAAELDRREALDRNFIARWVTGADAYLAAARDHRLQDASEICGVPLEDILTLCDWIEGSSHMATVPGVGMERGRSGGAGLRAAMALNALMGHHGRPGAGVMVKPGLSLPKTTGKLQGDHLIDPDTRVINILDVAQVMEDRSRKIPIAAVMIYNHNPVATHPDQAQMIKALSREDIFVVGSDVVMTDSMAYCDVILPASSHFEYSDIYGAYGQNYLQRAEPVIAPVGESLPNTEIFRRLAARFGFEGEEFQASDAELMADALDDTDQRFEGRSPATMGTDEAWRIEADNGAALVLCDSVLPATPSGKIELFSADLEAAHGCGLPCYSPVNQSLPFALITPSSDKRINATFGNAKLSPGIEELEMHPEDAQDLGFANGDLVRIQNELGAVSLSLKVTNATRPGVLYVAKGAWLRSSDTGFTANVLIPATARTDIGNGAAYNETYVEVVRAG